MMFLMDQHLVCDTFTAVPNSSLLSSFDKERDTGGKDNKEKYLDRTIKNPPYNYFFLQCFICKLVFTSRHASLFFFYIEATNGLCLGQTELNTQQSVNMQLIAQLDDLCYCSLDICDREIQYSDVLVNMRTLNKHCLMQLKRCQLYSNGCFISC